MWKGGECARGVCRRMVSVYLSAIGVDGSEPNSPAFLLPHHYFVLVGDVRHVAGALACSEEGSMPEKDKMACGYDK